MRNIKRNCDEQPHNDGGLRNYLTNNIIIPTSCTYLWPLSVHTKTDVKVDKL